MLYYVYVLTNKTNSVLYVGVTNDLIRRLYEHENKLADGFTSKYNVSKLVHFDIFTDVNEALQREKTLKKWSRAKKNWLIELSNPTWKNLKEDIL